MSALELGRRSVHGPAAYPVLALFTVLGTPLRTEHPGVSAFVVAMLTVLAVARISFGRGFEARYDQVGERAGREFTILLLMQCSVVSFSSAAVVAHYGAASQSLIALLFCVSAAAAGTSSLATRPAIHRIFLAVIMVPIGFALIPGLGQTGVVLLLGTLVLAVFYVREGYAASLAYRGLVTAQLDLVDAVQQVKTLHGIVPICAYCKNIRDDTGFWEDVSSYLQSRIEADFSHSICPDCAEKHFPDLYTPKRKSAVDR